MHMASYLIGLSKGWFSSTYCVRNSKLPVLILFRVHNKRTIAVSPVLLPQEA